MAQTEQVRIKDLFTLDETIAKPYLEQFTYPWEALAGIHDYILELGPTLPKDLYDEVKENVWIAKSAKVFDTAYIGAPCIIGENTEVRQSAFIRQKFSIQPTSELPASSAKIRKCARAHLSAEMRSSAISA